MEELKVTAWITTSPNMQGFVWAVKVRGCFGVHVREPDFSRWARCFRPESTVNDIILVRFDDFSTFSSRSTEEGA